MLAAGMRHQGVLTKQHRKNSQKLYGETVLFQDIVSEIPCIAVNLFTIGCNMNAHQEIH
jgi:hypothetical protein